MGTDVFAPKSQSRVGSEQQGAEPVQAAWLLCLPVLHSTRLGMVLGGSPWPPGRQGRVLPYPDTPARSQSWCLPRSLRWVIALAPGIGGLHPRVALTTPGGLVAMAPWTALGHGQSPGLLTVCRSHGLLWQRQMKVFGAVTNVMDELQADTADVEGASAFPTPDG